MNATIPVAGNLVVERRHDARRGNHVGAIQTWVAEVAPDLEVTNLREGVDCCSRGIALVIARQRHVHARAVLTCYDVSNAILHHGKCASEVVPFGVEGRVGSDQHHVACHGRRPYALRVIEKLDGGKAGVA